jgi:UDP-N-acetylmuramate--alanine ligase
VIELPDTVPAVETLGRIHLIGVGGRGMSGIASILAARGIPVTGSDARDSAAVTAVRALGVPCAIGHDAANLGDADTVVVSTAIPADNVELVEAHRRGLPVLHRTTALVALMAGARTVAVAGTHGKTTTTSMLTVALQHLGADPSFAVGGNLVQSGANAHHGSGDVFVAETDESDGSFVLFGSDVSVVTNIDFDHVDQHPSREAYVATFDAFVARTPASGVLVVCADDPDALALGQRWADRRRVVSYGTTPGADLRLDDLRLDGTRSTATPVLRGRRLGPLQLQVPGRHNALNAAAALLAGLELGYSDHALREGLAGFHGTARRFEPKGTAAGVRVYDDFAHHPTELAAALAAAREVAGVGRVVVVFQSQLYSRTEAFAADFGAALGAADEVVVMDVFGSREDPVPGVTGGLIADAVPLPSEVVHFVPSWSDVPRVAADALATGDLLLTTGSGDVTLIGPEVLALLRDRADDAADQEGPTAEAGPPEQRGTP